VASVGSSTGGAVRGERGWEKLGGELFLRAGPPAQAARGGT